jgi:uncharacterized membrane protein
VKVCFAILLALWTLSANLLQAGAINKDSRLDEAAAQYAKGEPYIRLEKRGKRTYVVGTVFIKARPENVWDVLVDYHNAPGIFKNLKLCEVVGRKGKAKLVRQVVGNHTPLPFDYVVALTEDKPRHIEWARESGSLKEVTGTWQLEPVDSGKQTKTVYSIFIDGGILLPSWLLTPQLQSYMPVVLKAVRNKVESVNGQ